MRRHVVGREVRTETAPEEDLGNHYERGWMASNMNMVGRDRSPVPRSLWTVRGDRAATIPCCFSLFEVPMLKLSQSVIALKIKARSREQ